MFLWGDGVERGKLKVFHAGRVRGGWTGAGQPTPGRGGWRTGELSCSVVSMIMVLCSTEIHINVSLAWRLIFLSSFLVFFLSCSLSFFFSIEICTSLFSLSSLRTLSSSPSLCLSSLTLFLSLSLASHAFTQNIVPAWNHQRLLKTHTRTHTHTHTHTTFALTTSKEPDLL